MTVTNTDLPPVQSDRGDRNGTRDLFAALEIATGTVITDIRARPSSADFVAFLNKINREVPNARSALTGVFVAWLVMGVR